MAIPSLTLTIITSLWRPKILFPTPLRSPATLRLISGTCYNIWDNWFSWEEYKGASPWPTEMRPCTLPSLCRLENLSDACNYQLLVFLCFWTVWEDMIRSCVLQIRKPKAWELILFPKVTGQLVSEPRVQLVSQVHCLLQPLKTASTEHQVTILKDRSDNSTFPKQQERKRREDSILEKQSWQNTNNHSRPLAGKVSWYSKLQTSLKKVWKVQVNVLFTLMEGRVVPHQLSERFIHQSIEGHLAGCS